VPSFNGPREVRGEDLIDHWLAEPHASERVDAFLEWFGLVYRSPGDFISGEIVGITEPAVVRIPELVVA